MFHQVSKITTIIMLIALLGLATGSPVRADHGGTLSEKDQNLFDSVSYDQKLDAQLPLDLTFRDETGTVVQLEQYFGEKPVILVMAYYECPMLCTFVLNGLLAGLTNVDFDIGNEFEVVTLSIDPGETPQMAAAKKATYVEAYGRPEAEAGWHFLTGDRPAIERLTEAVGFHYVYDEQSDEYAHPTGMIVLTPEGRISRYLYGIEFPATDVRLGLVEASNNIIGSPIDQVLLMCYHYDPDSGQYTPAIMNIIRLAGGITTLLIGVPILSAVWRNRRTSRALA
ncbi:MAG: SCO family protein [Anaerolineae bacterium]|nr:SCO family protein [Anaerolineae bacterium]